MLKKIKDWIGSNLDVYKVESASDVGAGLYRHVWKGKENATQIGTTLNAEIMNNLQNSLVHSINATKTTGTGTDYYICNLEGLTEFGLNNDLKLRITVDNANTNTTTKLRLNNVDYTLLKEQNGTLKQIEAGDIHSNKTYELIYNGSQFVVINLFKNFESSYLDNCIKKTDFAEENKAGIISLSAVKGLIPNVPNATSDTAGKVMLGTTANTALEGKRLAEIIGMEFGGNIQDVGTKVAGKFYYDRTLKHYYECIVNNALTYNDESKYRAISNKPISDRLENLFKIKKQTINIPNGFVSFAKQGNIVSVNVLIQDNTNNLFYLENQKLVDIPQNFLPLPESHGLESSLAFSSLSGAKGATRIQINPTIITIWGADNGRFNILKGSATYYSKI